MHIEAQNKRDFKLSVNERLKGKKNIEELFNAGSSFSISQIRVRYLTTDGPRNRVMFVVPKKIHKRAVDRNYIKRRFKEAYRLNKHILLDNSSSRYHIAFMYLSKDIPKFVDIESKLILALNRLAKREMS